MRVLISDSDAAARQRLAQRLNVLSSVRVIGAVDDLSATYTIAEHKVPNLVLLATSLAQKPEFEVLCLLFRALSIQCVLISVGALATESERRLAARAGLSLWSPEQSVEVLRSDEFAGHVATNKIATKFKERAQDSFDNGFILIGASTGGVDALIRVLTAFPKNCPATLVVQHTGSQFTKGLARLMDGHVAPKVSEAIAGMRPLAGQVLIAPGGDQHLVLAGKGASVRCGFDRGNAVQGHCPSVDALFGSAVPIADRVTAAILTGMGRDGAEGLLALRRAGAMTFGQDEKTSVVFGMPRAAFERGAVAKQLPLEAIGPALLRARGKAG